MSYYKIGFHGGIAGNMTGIGKPDGYMPTLDAAGKPFGIMSADEHGVVFESYLWNGALHNRAFRQTKYSVPNYAAEPDVAARITWQGIMADLPPEFSKETWIVVWNEPDKNRSDWLGYAAYEIGQLALQDEYKVALFGFSGGEPEYDHWLTPGMNKFLKLCDEHPEQISVALHEYSFTLDHLVEDIPYYLVGRFQQLFDACEEQGIGRPTVHILEFGWVYENVPTPEDAIPQLQEAADLYAMYPEVKLVAIWYLGGGFGGIADQAQRLIEPVTQAALVYEPPDIVPDPDPDPDDKHKAIVVKSPQKVTAEEWREISDYSLAFRHTQTASHDDMLILMENGNKDSFVKVFEPDRPSQVESIALLDSRGFEWEPHYLGPAPGELVLKVFPTDYPVFTQTFGVNPQNYNMYCDEHGICLPGHNGLDISAPMGTPYYAAVEGQVIWASDQRPSGGLSDYGYHIRIRTGDYIIIYAHAAPDLRVQAGDDVVAGQIIAVSGDTGRSTGAHLHFEMRKCPGLPNWPWCIIDPTPFIQPLMDDQPPVGMIDMAPYFQVVDAGYGPFFVLQHSDGQTENIQTLVTNGEIQIVKGGGNYERLRVYGDFIERKEDTSHENNLMYTLDDGHGWSRWAPRLWKPGDTFYRNPVVTLMDKSCNVISTNQVGSLLRFDKFHPEWTSPSGLEFFNVIELSFRFSPLGERLERYWLAPNLGPYAEWTNNQGRHSWVSEIPTGREPLKPEVITCL